MLSTLHLDFHQDPLRRKLDCEHVFYTVKDESVKHKP